VSYATNLNENAMTALPEFFHFWDENSHERWTSWETDLTFDGETYTAIPVYRTGYSKDIKFSSVKITVRLPIDVSTFAIRYIENHSSLPLKVGIYRALSSDLTDYVTLIEGEVKETAIQEKAIEYKCEQHSSFLDFRIPKVLYQSYCNWDIYDSDCGLDMEAHKVNSVITDIDGSDYSANAFSNYADGYFENGIARCNNDMRLITKHVGDTITLQVPFISSVVIGHTIDAFPGCFGSPTLCRTRFGNLSKFLGFPYIPSHNPVHYGLERYLADPRSVS